MFKKNNNDVVTGDNVCYSSINFKLSEQSSVSQISKNTFRSTIQSFHDTWDPVSIYSQGSDISIHTINNSPQNTFRNDKLIYCDSWNPYSSSSEQFSKSENNNSFVQAERCRKRSHSLSSNPNVHIGNNLEEGNGYGNFKPISRSKSK